MLVSRSDWIWGLALHILETGVCAMFEYQLRSFDTAIL
jgi:hypothetical protein